MSHLPAEEIVSRDAKEYEASSGQQLSIAQVETVGKSLLERKDELLEALDGARERNGHALTTLMITDILSRSTDLLVSGDESPVEKRAQARTEGSCDQAARHDQPQEAGGPSAPDGSVSAVSAS